MSETNEYQDNNNANNNNTKSLMPENTEADNIQLNTNQNKDDNKEIGQLIDEEKLKAKNKITKIFWIITFIINGLLFLMSCIEFFVRKHEDRDLIFFNVIILIENVCYIILLLVSIFYYRSIKCKQCLIAIGCFITFIYLVTLLADIISHFSKSEPFELTITKIRNTILYIVTGLNVLLAIVANIIHGKYNS